MSADPAALVPLEGSVSVFLGLVLLMSASHKLAALERSSTAVAGLLGLTRPSRPLALLAASVEIALGILVVVPGYRSLAATGAAGLWLIYAALLQRMIASGRRGFDCGCSLSRRSGDTADQRWLATGLAAIATVIALLPASAAPGFGAVLAGFGFLALYLAAGELLAVRTILENSR